MDKIRQREFTGSVILLGVLMITVIGIPAAIVYLINGTVEIEHEVEDAAAFWQFHKKKHSWFLR